MDAATSTAATASDGTSLAAVVMLAILLVERLVGALKPFLLKDEKAAAEGGADDLAAPIGKLLEEVAALGRAAVADSERLVAMKRLSHDSLELIKKLDESHHGHGARDSETGALRWYGVRQAGLERAVDELRREQDAIMQALRQRDRDQDEAERALRRILEDVARTLDVISRAVEDLR